MEENLLKELRTEAQRIEEDSIHSAKGHWNAGGRWGYVHLAIGVPNTVLAAAAGAQAFQGHDDRAGWMALGVAVVAGLNTFLNPSERASTHKRCGDDYSALKNKARMFVNITSRLPLSDDEFMARFEEMAARRDELNTQSPQIPWWAFKKAKKGIDEGQSTYKL